MFQRGTTVMIEEESNIKKRCPKCGLIGIGLIHNVYIGNCSGIRKLIVENEMEIPGEGKIFVVSPEKNGEIRVEDQFKKEGKEYTVKSIKKTTYLPNSLVIIIMDPN